VIILGIDPGSRITGYGFLEKEGNRLRLLDAGPIRLEKEGEIPQRLQALCFFLEEKIREFSPDALSVEKVFHGPNFKATVLLSYVRGVVLMLAGRYELDVFEYAPSEVKKAVTGYGRAEKVQVQEMVKILLKLPSVPKPNDVADAIALSICHAHQSPAMGRLRGR